jgi:hypothetical protein
VDGLGEIIAHQILQSPIVTVRRYVNGRIKPYAAANSDNLKGL